VDVESIGAANVPEDISRTETYSHTPTPLTPPQPAGCAFIMLEEHASRGFNAALPTAKLIMPQDLARLCPRGRGKHWAAAQSSVLHSSLPG
ncbi:unnamed protein product, partial [Polarella glacialis]